MRRKTALVTGGTSGVGLSLVRALAGEGADVHFIGTNEDRGRAIEGELHGEGGSTCRFIKLDLSSMGATKAFAAEFASEVDHLDVLANVAGVVLPERQETSEGLEKTFAIDFLSAFVLSQELTPRLAAASHARIVNVSGAPMQVTPPQLDFDDLDFKRKYQGIRVAIRSVHAKTVMTAILAERLREHSIDVNAFHPGTVKSSLGRDLSWPLRTLLSAAGFFLSETSKSGVYVSTAEELNGVTGQLFVNKKPRPLVYEAAYKERLWTESEAMVERALS